MSKRFFKWGLILGIFVILGFVTGLFPGVYAIAYYNIAISRLKSPDTLDRMLTVSSECLKNIEKMRAQEAINELWYCQDFSRREHLEEGSGGPSEMSMEMNALLDSEMRKICDTIGSNGKFASLRLDCFFDEKNTPTYMLLIHVLGGFFDCGYWINYVPDKNITIDFVQDGQTVTSKSKDI